MKKIISIIIFVSFFLTYTNKLYLPIFPGYCILQAFTFLIFILYIYHCLRKKQIVVPHLLVYIFFFFIWVFITSIWAKQSWIVFQSIQEKFLFLIFPFGIYYIFSKFPEIYKNFYNITLLSIFAISLSYFIKIVYFNFSLQSLFGYPFGNPNIAASIVGFGFLFVFINTFIQIFDKQYKDLPVNVCLIVFFTTILFLTGCKGFFLAFCIAIGVLLYLLFPKYRFIFFVIIPFFIIFIFIYQNYLLDKIWASLEVRLYIWKYSCKMLLYSPLRFLFGWGPGNFFPNFVNFQEIEFFTIYYKSEIVRYPHNLFLEIFIEYGVVGLFLFVFFVIKGLKISWTVWQNNLKPKMERETSLVIFAGIILVLVHAQISIAFCFFQTQFLWMLCFGWLACNQVRVISFNFYFRKTIFVFSIIVFISVWKLTSFDFLKFHWKYKKIIKTDDKNKLQKISKIKAPCFENLYTLKWRCDIGAIFFDSSPTGLPTEQKPLKKFLMLEKYFPKFGYFLLYRALLYSKSSQPELADQSFLYFAAYNPFCRNLWLWWAFACRNKQASVHKMLAAARFYNKVNLDNKIPLFGEALALHILGRTTESVKLMKQVYKWGSKRLERWHSSRINELTIWAEQFLKKAEKLENK